MTSSLVTSLRAELAKITSPSEAKDLADKTAAIRRYLKVGKRSLSEQLDIASVHYECEGRLGEMLKSVLKRGGDSKSHAVTLESLALTKSRSSRAQRLGSLLDFVPEYMARCQVAEKESSMVGLLIFASTGVYSSETPEWCTPPEIVELVVKVLGEIDLDPCADPKKTIPATEHFTEKRDGLKQDWEGRVYMNPPYGGTIGKWVKKLVTEYEEGAVTEAIALVPARTDTKWFRLFRDYPVCFLFGRLKFSDSEQSAPFPSMAVYLGSAPKRFAKVFSSIGDTYVRLS